MATNMQAKLDSLKRGARRQEMSEFVEIIEKTEVPVHTDLKVPPTQNQRRQARQNSNKAPEVKNFPKEGGNFESIENMLDDTKSVIPITGQIQQRGEIKYDSSNNRMRDFDPNEAIERAKKKAVQKNPAYKYMLTNPDAQNQIAQLKQDGSSFNDNDLKQVQEEQQYPQQHNVGYSSQDLMEIIKVVAKEVAREVMESSKMKLNESSDNDRITWFNKNQMAVKTADGRLWVLRPATVKK